MSRETRAHAVILVIVLVVGLAVGFVVENRRGVAVRADVTERVEQATQHVTALTGHLQQAHQAQQATLEQVHTQLSVVADSTDAGGDPVVTDPALQASIESLRKTAADAKQQAQEEHEQAQKFLAQIHDTLGGQ